LSWSAGSVVRTSDDDDDDDKDEEVGGAEAISSFSGGQIELAKTLYLGEAILLYFI
jgi:hypothetical protein